MMNRLNEQFKDLIEFMEDNNMEIDNYHQRYESSNQQQKEDLVLEMIERVLEFNRYIHPYNERNMENE